MNGDKSSPLEMAEERSSWSSLSPDSPLSVELATTFRRVLDEFIEYGCGYFDGGVRNGRDLGKRDGNMVAGSGVGQIQMKTTSYD